MSSLYLLGTGAAFRSCRSLCSICTSEVRKFFYVFLDAIVDMKEEYIYMPKNITELNHVSSSYGVAGLPGCCGSIDVVHVKWANCPAGDFNRAKGKETFPSPGFQCITDFNRRVLHHSWHLICKIYKPTLILIPPHPANVSPPDHASLKSATLSHQPCSCR